MHYITYLCSLKRFALSLFASISYKPTWPPTKATPLFTSISQLTRRGRCHTKVYNKNKSLFRIKQCLNFVFGVTLWPKLFLFITGLTLASALSATPQITIVWGTTTIDGSAEVLKDANGNPLSAGVQGNGDGDLVELGYFTSATTSDPFSGQWIALTRQTHVGDSSSGYGFNDGMFIFTTNFLKNRDYVVVFPTEPKEFEDNPGFTITATTPPPGTPVCIRFYDKPTLGGANYNTVTGAEWLWPSFPSGSSIPSNHYFKISNIASSWKTGAIFEDPANPFKTSLSPTYTIGVSNYANSTGSGTISDINGSYTWGQEINITATPGPHSYFNGWIGSGLSDPWTENTTLTVDGAQTIYAEFALVPYFLNLEVNGNGSVTGGGSFSFGDSVDIFASPDYGHSFSHWENNGTHFSSNAIETISIPGNLDLVAVFTRNTYDVLIGAELGGSYELLDTNGSTPQIIEHGVEYFLRSIPEKHFGFNSWITTSDGISMLGNQNFAHTSFIPTADVNITASFFEISYQLNIESTQGYSSLSSSGQFPALSIVPVEVEVQEGFVFDYWQDPLGILANPNLAQTEANISKIYPHDSASVSAILRLDDYDESDINITADAGGNILFQTDDSGGFTHFTSYELNATASLGYRFDQWVGNTEQLEFGSKEKNNKFLIEGPLSLRASFTLSEYELNLSSSGEGTTLGPENFTMQDTPSIKAIPFQGNRFTHWSGDTEYLLDHLTSETFIVLEDNSVPEDLSLIANFVPENYQISLNTEGNGSADIILSSGESFNGVAFQSVTVDSETQIVFETIAQDGWSFSNWRGLPGISELYNPLAHVDQYSSVIYFYPSSDLNITAEFKITEYDDTQIVVNSGNGGDVLLESEESGNFLHFSSYDLNATPVKGYEFNGWLLDTSQESLLLYNTSSSNNRLRIEGGMEINASFSIVDYDIEILDQEGGETTAPASFNVYDSPLLIAMEDPGWDFSHWSGDTQYLLDPNASQTTIDHTSLPLRNLSFTPNFVLESYLIGTSTEGSGTVDLSKNEILFIADATQEIIGIDSATRFGANALPINGWKFSQWFGLPESDSLRDSEPNLNPLDDQIDFIPVEDINISAKFERDSYSLNIDQTEIGGSATGGGVYLFETVVDINATPQEHYLFERWNGGDTHLVHDPSEANNKLRIPSFNVQIQPTFVPKVYSINALSDENGSFQISGTHNEITQINQTEYNATSSITISAVPLDAESHMLNYMYWENTLGETGFSYSSTFNIPFLDANYSFWAYFTERNEIGYSLIATPPYAGSAGENSSFSSAQFQRLVAQPNTGYSFIGWESKTGEAFSQHWSLYSVDTELQETSEIWAHFQPKINYLTLEYNQSQGAISGFTDEINYGTNLILTASADENFTFVNWELIKETTFEISRNNSSIHSSETRLFINNQESPELSLARGFTYHFDCNLSSSDEFFISTSADSSDQDAYYLSGITGHLTSEGVLTFEVPMDAPSMLYYHGTGSNYSGNRIKISTVEDSSILPNPNNPVFSNRVTQHFGLRANFERTRHTISVSSSGQGTTDYTEQDIYFWGDEISITATPSDHWYFSHWEGSSHIQNPDAMQTILSVVENTEVRAIFKQVEYRIDVNATPADYGLLNAPTETSTYGEYVTLSASPLIGKQFDEWSLLENLSLDNPEDRFNQTADFKVLGDAKAQANFSKIALDLNIQLLSLDQNNQAILGDIGASVSRPDVIYHGDSVALELNPFTGYTFLYWVDLDSGEIVTTQKAFSTIITYSRNFQAVLRKNHYQIDLSANEGGSSEMNATYPYYWGDTISLLATPDEHWEFYKWTGVGSEHLENEFSPSTSLTIQKDSAINAEFRPKDYTLTISFEPDGYGGYSSIENIYNYGNIAEIEAIPRAGKLFHGWKIDANATLESNYSNTSNPAQFTILGNAKLTALFKSKEYNISYQVVVEDEFGLPQDGIFGGRILGRETAEDEEVVEFHISLANGYKLDHWRNEANQDIVLSTETIYTHEMLADLNLTAVVTERKYEVDLKISPSVGGNAQLNDFPVSESLLRDDFSYGDDINISAYAEEGYRFVKWDATGASLGSPNQENQSFSLGNDIKLTAYFAPEGLVNLSLVSEPDGAASYLFGGGSFEYNPDHAILAMPKQGYLFSHWDFNGSDAVGIVKDAYSSTTSLALDGNKELTAVFVVDADNPPSNEDSNKLYLLSVYSDNSSQGTTSGSGFFRGVRTIQAYAKEGFEFSHWEGATFSNAYDATTQISVFENTSVVAHFQSVGVFDDSSSLDNGWWGNPWFGYFWKVGDEDWLFHEKLGWIYMKKKGDQSIWVWIQKMEDWFWTAKEHYPYLHSSSVESWYFVNLESSDFTRLVIYDYANSEWLSK